MKVYIVLPVILGFLVSAFVGQAGDDPNILSAGVNSSISNTKAIKDESGSTTKPEKARGATIPDKEIEGGTNLNAIIGGLENEIKKTNVLIEDQARKIEELTAKVEPVSGASVNRVASYTEWVVITLTALGVMIAIFTVGLSILAVVGYRDIKANAAKRAENEVKKQLADDGELRPFVEDILISAANRFLYPPFDDLELNDELEPDDE